MGSVRRGIFLFKIVNGTQFFEKLGVGNFMVEAPV
jgi:hypothetical protein